MTAAASVIVENDAFEARPGSFDEWDRLLRQAGKSALEHSWQYGEAVAALHGIGVTRRVIQHGGAPAALVQGFRTRDLKVGSINRIVRGPVWLQQLSTAHLVAACRLMRREFRPRVTDLLFWLPDLPDNGESRDLMTALGMRRMVTGYSTAWLDIRPDAERLLTGLHGKWRNGLRTAEKSGIRVRPADRDKAFEKSLAAYDRFRRNRKFIGPPAELIRNIHGAPRPSGNSANVRIWEAIHGNEPVAGIAIVRHGVSATYLAGWTDDAGRRRNAHNLLLWRAIAKLRESGTEWLDLGGVDTDTSPGIARFKLGLGGELATAVGTYL